MLHKRFLLVSSIIACMVSLTACSMSNTPQTVKVGASFPLVFEFCQDMVNAAQLAVDEVNGQAGNIKVELVVFDTSDANNPDGVTTSRELEEEFGTQMVNDPLFVAHLGPPFSSIAKVSIPVLNPGGIPQISPLATWPGLTKPGYGPGEPGIYYPSGNRTFFRTVPSDEVQGGVAARWAKELGFETVYILNNLDPYGVGITGIFELTAKDIGLQVIAHEVYGEEVALYDNVEDILQGAIDANPDLVYLVGGTGAGADYIIKTLREGNPDMAIMTPDSLVHAELISLLGADLAEGIYGTTVGIPASELNTATAATFAQNYQAAYGKEPAPPDVTTYEAMKVLLYAIEHAEEPTREGVLEVLQNLNDYSGILGEWSFDERGDISLPAISGMQVQNGEWTFAKTLK